ncbi:hypothetical protein FYJ38_24430 [Clostridium sp. WB02_MRS01]|uniref:hypothetical protein n=1 Tax=Clostridium sp. WB02_MRS01 TaxID=2605777 RepID=UPI0012B3A529|nr:hypothetical protein [Clostridium sp. WB02_MRS01]MSS11757.1 hypothetical protein [Clostridium sp. WB02_MRS01]
MNKETTSKILIDFMNRNREYAIESYLKTESTEDIIGRFIIPCERSYNQNTNGGDRFRITWGRPQNGLIIPYGDVIACYQEKDEYGSQTVHVIMMGGVTIDLECCGDRV